MNDNNNNPPYIELDGEPQPIQVFFSEEEANFFIQKVDFYQPVIKAMTQSCPPGDLVVLLAFLIAAIETQKPDTGPAFDEIRVFFNAIYPNILAHDAEKNPQSVDEDGCRVVVPRATPGKRGIDAFSTEPKIILSGSDWKN